MMKLKGKTTITVTKDFTNHSDFLSNLTTANFEAMKNV